MPNSFTIQEAFSKYKFYHNISLGNGIVTPGNPEYVPAQQLCMSRLKTINLVGKRVLDIGCRDGLFSFAAEKMGASEVIGIDNDLSKPATEFLIPYFKSKVIMKEMNVYNLTPLETGRFDVVIFPGVLYHLRYPFWALKVIRDVMTVGSQLIIETPLWECENDRAILFCPTGKDSPYESSSCTFFNEKGIRDTLVSLGFTVNSVDYLADQRDLVLKTKIFFSRMFNKSMRVTRSVIVSTFSEHSRDEFLNRYWESTHNWHSNQGG